MKLSMYLPFVLICFFSVPVSAAEALDFEDETVQVNYSLGHQIGGDFKRQGVEMNAEAVVQGIRDALAGNAPQMSPEDMNATLMALKRKVVADQRKRSVENELAMLKEGEEFLEQNAKKEGVITTASGLQYKVIKEGSGRSPGPNDEVTVHYRATKLDGTEADSSFKKNKPATFRLNRVIDGWSEGLRLMKEGGKSRLFIPQKLAYRDRGPLAHRTLIVDVELISVNSSPSDSAQKETPAQDEAMSGE